MSSKSWRLTGRCNTRENLVTRSFLTIVTLLIAFCMSLHDVRATEDNRFTMTPTEDGFLRLDSQTGSVSVCSRKDGNWGCSVVADDRIALQDKIDKLSKENSELRAQVKELEEFIDSEIPGNAESSKEKPGLQLPNEEDVDKALGFIENLLKRFKDMAERLKEDDSSGKGIAY